MTEPLLLVQPWGTYRNTTSHLYVVGCLLAAARFHDLNAHIVGTGAIMLMEKYLDMAMGVCRTLMSYAKLSGRCID